MGVAVSFTSITCQFYCNVTNLCSNYCFFNVGVVLQEESKAAKSGEKKRWIHDPSSKNDFNLIELPILNFIKYPTYCALRRS